MYPSDEFTNDGCREEAFALNETTPPELLIESFNTTVPPEFKLEESFALISAKIPLNFFSNHASAGLTF